jgi:3-hydroxyacyl-CoA dehydrogenase
VGTREGVVELSKAITIHGLGLFGARMAKRSVNVQAAARVVVNDTATDVFNASQRAVPVDLGNLKGSGRLEPAAEGEFIARVSYGGTAAEYALIVHETHATKSKYLERPAREHLQPFKEAIRKAIRGAIR